MATDASDLRVAVWYGGLFGRDGDGEGDYQSALTMLRTLYCIMSNFERAYEIVSYGKGVVLDNLHPDAAYIVAKWIEAEGGVASIDHLYHEE